MKLRYYLRGLGIGMLVAALILVLSGNTGGRMSDEAVKRRAGELGMVEKDKSVLEQVGSEVTVSENKAAGTPAADTQKEPSVKQPEEAQAAKPENPPQKAETEQNLENADNGQKNETAPAQNKEQELADKIEQRADEVAERGKEVAENTVPKKIVVFSVERGDSSISVARKAKEMGLVESAADFDVFLCQNGYDKRISIGSYEIAEGASEKEIADKITKSN